MRRLLTVVLLYIVYSSSPLLFAQVTDESSSSLSEIISDVADAESKTKELVAQADTESQNNEQDVVPEKDDVLSITPKSDEKKSLDMDTIVEGIITDLTASPVDNRKYKELLAKYNDLTSQFEVLKKNKSEEAKVVQTEVRELKLQLREAEVRYTEQKAEQQKQIIAGKELNEQRILKLDERMQREVDAKGTKLLLILIAVVSLFIAAAIYFFYRLKSTVEKSIDAGIEARAGIEVQRFLASIKLEERLEQKGHHRINEMFAEIGHKSRDTIKKLEGIQHEYEGTLVTLKDRFEQTSDDAIREQFDVIELKSQDKIQSLNDIQAEYEVTLHKLKEKVTEITGHLSIKGESDLLSVVEELEHKSATGISRLDNIQDEYESTLESLKSKIKDVEDKIVEKGAEAIKGLFEELDQKSEAIVVRLNEIQGEYEETLKRLEHDVSTAEEQLLEKGDVVLKSFLNDLEKSSERHFDELKKKSDTKIIELNQVQSEFNESFQHLTEKVEHVADDVTAKGNDAVVQIMTESERYFDEFKDLSTAKLTELEEVQEQFDGSIQKLSEKVDLAVDEVATKSENVVQTLLINTEEHYAEIRKQSNEKIMELTHIHDDFDESFQLLSEKVERVADEVSIKGNEAVLQLLTELEKSTVRVKELDTIRDMYEQTLSDVRQRMDECETDLKSSATVSLQKLLTDLEEKSEGKIIEINEIKQKYDDELAELKRHFVDAEEQITAVDVPTMEVAFKEIVETSEEQINKLAHVRNEYQATLESLTERTQRVETALSESTEVAIENLFNEIEARSENKIGELDELQTEFELTLVNLKDKVKETEVKIVETNESRLEELSQRLETKSNDEIRKLNELQHEYLNTLNFLNEKIEECEHERLKHEALPAELEFEVYSLMEKAKKDFKHNEFKAVADTLCKVIALAPRDDTAYMLRAKTYVELDLESKALDDLAKVIKLAPDNQEALRTRASIAKKLHENDDAIEALTALIELNESDDALYSERGVIFGRINRDNDAVADFTCAINLAPEKAEPYFFRSLVYKKSGEADKAIEDLTAALAINSSAAYFKNRAILFSRTGRYSQAIDDFEAAIAIDGGVDFSNRVNLAKNMILTDRAGESCEMLFGVVEDAPKVQDKIMCLFYLSLSAALSNQAADSYFEQFSSVVDSADVTMNCYLTDIEKWLSSQELEQTQRSFIDRCIASLKSLRK